MFSCGESLRGVPEVFYTSFRLLTYLNPIEEYSLIISMNVDSQVRSTKPSGKREDCPIPHGLVQPTWVRDDWPTVNVSGGRNNMVVRIGINNITIVPGGPSIQAELVPKIVP